MGLLSFGNRKLPDTTAIFNLPAVTTCPGSTKACERYCYALKAERLYKGVKLSRRVNLAAAESDSFADLMIQAITDSGRKVVRIHESGDFYSQPYINKWSAIAAALQNVTFYFYTRSWQFDFDSLLSLKNVVGIFSLDPDSNEKALQAAKFFERAANVVEKDYSKKLKKHQWLCPGDCKICKVCSTKNKYSEILFKKH